MRSPWIYTYDARALHRPALRPLLWRLVFCIPKLPEQAREVLSNLPSGWLLQALAMSLWDRGFTSIFRRRAAIESGLCLGAWGRRFHQPPQTLSSFLLGTTPFSCVRSLPIVYCPDFCSQRRKRDQLAERPRTLPEAAASLSAL